MISFMAVMAKRPPCRELPWSGASMHFWSPAIQFHALRWDFCEEPSLLTGPTWPSGRYPLGVVAFVAGVSLRVPRVGAGHVQHLSSC